MTATRKRKQAKKPIRLEMTRLALAGWCFGLLVVLLWMFLLGLLLGKGITPANINVAEIKKRMIAEGVWPGSGNSQTEEKSAPTAKPDKDIPLDDLEFYEELAKKKKGRFQRPAEAKPRAREEPTVAAMVPPTSVQSKETVTPEKTTSATARYTVQVASFKDLPSANTFVANLKGLQPRATIRQVDLPAKGRWYRVQVGELSRREEAVALALRLNQQYSLKTFVVELTY